MASHHWKETCIHCGRLFEVGLSTRSLDYCEPCLTEVDDEAADDPSLVLFISGADVPMQPRSPAGSR